MELAMAMIADIMRVAARKPVVPLGFIVCWLLLALYEDWKEFIATFAAKF
jgi:hypothetical protein